MSFLRVKVTPHARKEVCIRVGENVYAISVKEKAEGNQANIRMVQLLSAHLRIPKNKLRIVAGHKRRNKRVEVLE